ncbi:FAD-binding domain-containing protein [Leptolyngbya sp. FACHB-261]|uniref:FAD-binding domain-containing protein n=1 Tax=Leptolyngbya sp. FACHB-261 TaxID=2692806 RepID=UPI0016825B30|nr:FAD-binding domain-containing protein [Leptolyngbya sp. FACHB-261]MBD2101579.1 deoxyribodipyrimidine photo-lyase [Leptolyngbya sp. FACHB-261]
MRSPLTLCWHRRDLRLADNTALHAAWQHSQRLLGLFILDPTLLNPEEVAPVRVRFMLESLAVLAERYRQWGSRLLIIQGDPVPSLVQTAQMLEAQAVFFNRDVEPYAHERDRAAKTALEAVGIEAKPYWDMLHPPKTVLTGQGSPYTVYTPYWRNWSAQPKPEPYAAPSVCELTAEELETLSQAVGAIELPSAAQLGFDWDQELPVEPGEVAAQQILEGFCDQALRDYQEQRNFPANEGTSRLSAHIKFGTLGMRTLWAATQEVKLIARSDEEHDSIRTWQQELAWREFYQQALFHFPVLAAEPHRKGMAGFPWENDPEKFQSWCEGRTGYPIVDAAMRQMNGSGWMHNRCRMIVASFLTKDLLIDPRLGEKYFMQKLIDGDLAPNNGGWQWSASSGMDPKPLRIFNPNTQAQKFDPDAEYIRHWVPELRNLDAEQLVTGKISSRERDACGYPEPIVDHKQRQQMFKTHYQNVRTPDATDPMEIAGRSTSQPVI